MASEPMTVQEAIALIDAPPQPEDGDVLKFSAGKRYAAAWTVILAHARATTAGTGACETCGGSGSVGAFEDADSCLDCINGKREAGTGAGGGRVQRDYTNDHEHYHHSACGICQAEFIGGKGRTVCAVCLPTGEELARLRMTYEPERMGALVTAALAASARGAA